MQSKNGVKYFLNFILSKVGDFLKKSFEMMHRIYITVFSRKRPNFIQKIMWKLKDLSRETTDLVKIDPSENFSPHFAKTVETIIVLATHTLNIWDFFFSKTNFESLPFYFVDCRLCCRITPAMPRKSSVL